MLFEGPVEVAQRRVQQVVPWISGRFPLDDGGSLEVAVEGEMFEHVFAVAVHAEEVVASV